MWPPDQISRADKWQTWIGCVLVGVGVALLVVLIVIVGAATGVL